MSDTVRGGNSVDLNVQAGQSLKVSTITGTYTAVILSGAGAGTALATASSDGATYGPYSGAVTVRVTSSADGLVDYAVGVTPTLNYYPPAMFGPDASGNITSLVDGAGNAIRLPNSIKSRIPLPTMRPILDETSGNIAAATKPAGVTIGTESAPGEMYGSSIKIFIPAGLNGQKIIVPLYPDSRGNYPMALPKMEWRVKCDDWSALSRLYFWAAEDAAATNGYIWVVNDTDGKSRYSLFSAQKAEWNGVYRTMQTSPYFRVIQTGTPTAWDEAAPQYQIRSIALTVTTSAECTVWINRVASPQWKVGAVCMQLDGAYALSYVPIFREFQRRGWPGVASRANAEDATYMTDTQLIEVGQTWDVAQHISIGLSALSGSTTEAEVKASIQGFKRYISSMGVGGVDGRRFGVFLTNAGRYSGVDMAGVLRANGILMSRGRCSDAQFGIDPYGAATQTTEWGAANPSGYAPEFGRYNRWSNDSGDGGTVASRHTYAGSSLEKVINRCAAGADFAWPFIHRVQTYDGVTYPALGNNSPEFVSSMLAHLDSLVAAGRIEMISASDVDALTYERPGDIYLRWDGAWVSRSTGAVAL